jgi:hypothetical protein
MISPTQRKLLAAIIEEYDRAVKNEAKNWGAQGAARVAKRGIEVSLILSRLKANYKSIHALGDAGAIKWENAGNWNEVLRKGKFGRMLGGTRQVWASAFIVVPLDAGRAML